MDVRLAPYMAWPADARFQRNDCVTTVERPVPWRVAEIFKGSSLTKYNYELWPADKRVVPGMVKPRNTFIVTESEMVFLLHDDFKRAEAAVLVPPAPPIKTVDYMGHDTCDTSVTLDELISEADDLAVALTNLQARLRTYKEQHG